MKGLTKQCISVFTIEETREGLELPFVGKIAAGFASPAADYPGESIDINKLIIRNKEYTFVGRIEGTSMVDDRLQDGDLVIIDRSLEPRDCDDVLVYVDGNFTIKRVSVDKEGRIWLVPANASFPKVEVSEGSDFKIWGVVTYTITKHRR